MATYDQWRQRILTNLGSPGVDVELTEAQLDGIIDISLQLWNKYAPLVKEYPFEIIASQTIALHQFNDPEYCDRDKYPDTWISNILDVRFQDNERRILGPRAGFLEGYYLRWGYQGPRLFFALHAAERQYERLTGCIPDWYWNPDDRILYISSPSRNTRVMVLASRPRLLSEISIGREADFLKLSTARAKLILARITGSMGPIPGPAGTITTDANDLRSESKQEWKEVEDVLARSISSCPPPRWIN